MDGINNYSCYCKAGYTGDHCETGKFVVDVLSNFNCVNELMMMLPIARVTAYMILLEANVKVGISWWYHCDN